MLTVGVREIIKLNIHQMWKLFIPVVGYRRNYDWDGQPNKFVNSQCLHGNLHMGWHKPNSAKVIRQLIGPAVNIGYVDERHYGKNVILSKKKEEGKCIIMYVQNM